MYDREFKRMAVELNESHKSVAEVSKELEVCTRLLNLFNLWRRKFQEEGKHSLSGNGIKSLTLEEAEMERL